MANPTCAPNGFLNVAAATPSWKRVPGVAARLNDPSDPPPVCLLMCYATHHFFFFHSPPPPRVRGDSRWGGRVGVRVYVACSHNNSIKTPPDAKVCGGGRGKEVGGGGLHGPNLSVAWNEFAPPPPPLDVEVVKNKRVGGWMDGWKRGAQAKPGRPASSNSGFPSRRFWQLRLCLRRSLTQSVRFSFPRHGPQIFATPGRWFLPSCRG